MSEFKTPGSAAEFDMEEGLALALSYLEDPSDVPCPRCGPDKVEVVCYLDARSIEKGVVVPIPPEHDYTVVLYCHACGRAAALDLSRDEGQRDREAA
ncbi:MAG: hypothetical protein ACT443_14465 [Gemmatimonadota bacterium]